MARFPFQIMAVTLAFVSACAPGKGPAGGMGCSKTSSVLKTPKIVSATSASAFDPSKKANEEEQQSLFYKHFGQFKSKSTGGYLYIQSRAANDVMGTVAADAQWYRCSALLEFPKVTGEFAPPSDAGSPWHGLSAEQIEALRFPVRADPLKVRIYSAAHCLDYSINERVVLSVFSSTGQELPGFDKAYANFEVEIPELKAVKELRTALVGKLNSGVISSQNAIDILKGFQPAVRDMYSVFGVPANGPEPATPSPKQSCMLPPKATDGDLAKQYTCATYHDMVVLDVEFANLPAPKDALLRDLRELSLSRLKKFENDPPDIASATSMPMQSPWKDYATQSGFRMFLGQMLNSTCKDFMPPPACYTSSPGATPICPTPATDTEPAPTDASCTANLFPADPAMGDYPKVYTIKFSCAGVASPDCYEVPINSIQNLHYMRQMSRERLRTFSRYNIVASLPNLPGDLLNCGASTSGVCAVKNEVQSALNGVAPGLTLGTALSAAQFNGSSSPYVKAQKKVDGALEVWKDFFAANDKANSSSATSTLGGGGVTVDPSAFSGFKKQLNPINFLDLNANFIVQDRELTTLPLPADMDLRRAFLKLPISNIIGLNEFASFGADTSSDPRPIFIDSWSSGASLGGRFLRFWTTKNQLNSFLDNLPFNSSFGDHFSASDPSSYVVLFDKSTVDPTVDSIAQIPTQATLQKGDSGSIFTLDGIPMFALSTVNGEPTSGGAAVRTIPVDAPEVAGVDPGGGDNGGVGSGTKSVSTSAACK